MCWDAADQRFPHRRSNRTRGRITLLVLGHKVRDKLVIDGNITGEVVKIQGNRISLGIAAPSNVKILCGEMNLPKAFAQIV